MLRNTLIKRGSLVVAGLFIAVQFVPIDWSNPPVKSEVQAPSQVMDILVRACYDCHSNQTAWPWYSRVAPVSWWVADHVHEGRKDLNFSSWPVFDFGSQELFMLEISKQVASGKMPPRSYLVGHAAARLDEGEKQALLDWAQLGVGANLDQNDW